MAKVKYIPNQGDIVWLNLDPVSGHEQGGRRPVLVITKEVYSKSTNCFLMCPLTTKKKGYLTEVSCVVLGENSIILSDQIRCVDFTKRNMKYIATVSQEIMLEVNSKIKTLIEI